MGNGIYQLKELFPSFLTRKNDFRHIIICGMAKTGTSLIASLLDGHKSLTVFPEELRFMDASCHQMNAVGTVDKLLANPNIQHLQVDRVNYQSVFQSGGTGYGPRDYSDINFNVFSDELRSAFLQANSPEERYLSVFYAYCKAQTNSDDFLQSHLVSKAPHNEVFMHSWQKMFGERASFIWMVRDPVEHFYSMENIAKAVNAPKVEIQDFCHLINSRFQLMTMQQAPTIFIKYEDLSNKPDLEVAQVAEFLNIEVTESLYKPTKNGHEWLGNSSRGVRDNKIFKNPQIARQKLDCESVDFIMRNTQEFCQTFGY